MHHIQPILNKVLVTKKNGLPPPPPFPIAILIFLQSHFELLEVFNLGASINLPVLFQGRSSGRSMFLGRRTASF